LPPPNLNAPPQPTDIRCIQCGYDLSGTAIGGACPECGTPVAESLHPRLTPEQGRDRSNAVASVICGVGGLLCCGILAPFGLLLGYQVIKDAPAKGYSASTVSTARIGMWLGMAGCILWGLAALNEVFAWW